jgi:U3 small nucleolar RNA-associated protein 22
MTDCISIQFSDLAGDQRRPVITIAVTKTLSIRLIPMISQNVFTKIIPTKNSVRPAVFPSYATSIDNSLPTPQYNASLISDSSFLLHLNHLHAQTNKCPALKDAISIIKVWLAQRGFGGVDAVCSFGGFEMSMIMAHLVAKESSTGSYGYSAYQLFKLAINFLANFDVKQCKFLTESGTQIMSNDVSL